MLWVCNWAPLSPHLETITLNNLCSNATEDMREDGVCRGASQGLDSECVTPVTSRNSGRPSEEPRKEAGLGGRGDKKARNRLVFIDQRTGMIE